MAIAKQNELIEYYSEGADLTAFCTAPVIGKRCVKISGDRQAGPGLNTSVSGGNLSVALADVGGRIFGVAKWDAAANQTVGVKREPNSIVPITCSANIAAFAEVEVTANGMVATKNTGVAIGYAVTSATSGGDAQISLY